MALIYKTIPGDNGIKNIFIDIGANKGQTSKEMIDNFGVQFQCRKTNVCIENNPEELFIAFEPDEENVKATKAKANESNWTLAPYFIVLFAGKQNVSLG